MRNVAGSLLSRDCRGLTKSGLGPTIGGLVELALFGQVLTEAAAIISGPQAVIEVD